MPHWRDARRPLPCALLLVILLLCVGFARGSRTVVDEAGNRMTLPDHPRRVVCLAPSLADTVYALGAGDTVLAVSEYTRYPAEAAGKPKVGTILTPALEAIVALHPDLLLAMESEGGTAAVRTLRGLGLPVFLVDPHGLAGLFRSVLSVGEALNRSEAAGHEVADLRRRVAAVRSHVAVQPVISVFLPIWYDPVITIGRGAFLTELAEAAGARSVTADLPQEWPQIGIETVLARAPEALLLHRDGRMTLDLLRHRPGWSALAAVRQGRVFFVDDRIDLASPVAIDALEDLARELHP